MLRFLVLVTGLLAAWSLQATAGDAFLDSFPIPPEATFVGGQACVDCHREAGDFYAHSPHAPARNLTVPGTGIAACEACHGPGSLHVEGGGDGFIIGAEALSGLGEDRQARMCTQCHTARTLTFQEGNHAGTGVTCADCHADQAHFGGQAKPAAQFRNPAEFCLQCHAAQVGDFRLPYRHRVLEGQIACQDCHDPHGDFRGGNWDALNDTCLRCHMEMSGPFVFEHEGVSGEDCAACHLPHGSLNDKLLTQEGNGLCLQCHFEAGFDAADDWTLGEQAHPFLTQERRCYECHSAVHGSNLSAALTE